MLQHACTSIVCSCTLFGVVSSQMQLLHVLCLYFRSLHSKEAVMLHFGMFKLQFSAAVQKDHVLHGISFPHQACEIDPQCLNISNATCWHVITILICVGIFTLVFSVYMLTLHGVWSWFQPTGACFNLLRLSNPLKLRRRLLMKHERIVCYFLLFPVYIVYIGNCTLFCFTTIYCFIQTGHVVLHTVLCLCDAQLFSSVSKLIRNMSAKYEWLSNMHMIYLYSLLLHLNWCFVYKLVLYT